MNQTPTFEIAALASFAYNDGEGADSHLRRNDIWRCGIDRGGDGMT